MYKKYILPSLITFFGVVLLAGAQTLPVLRPSQGGTGIASTTPSNVGTCIKVLDDSPFTYELGTCGSGSGGGVSTSSPFSAGYIPFATSSNSITNSNIFQSGLNIGIGTTTPSSLLYILGTLKISATTTLGTVEGASLTACNSSTEKLLWSNGVFSCGTDAGAGGGITSLNGQTGSSQTFATSSDTNIQLTVTSTANVHTFTPVWAGTLADSRITSAATWNAKITTSSLSVAYGPLSYNNVTGVFTLPTSTASQSGFLSSADWTTFNNKAATSTFSATAPIFYNANTATFSLGITAVSSSRLLTAGSGLTGGGDLSADRTFTVGAGTNIVVNADDVAVTSTPSFTSIVASDYTSSTNIRAVNTTSTNLAVTGLTANRLIRTIANGVLQAVSALTDWIAGTTNQITVTDDGDGTVTLSLPQDIHTGAANFRVAGATTTALTISGLKSGFLSVGATGIVTTSTIALADTNFQDTVNFASSTWLKVLNNLSDLNNAATARTNLGVAIGTNVQAWDNDLDDFAALAPTKGDLITTAGTDWTDFAVGANGKVLTASSTATNGISWETVVASASPAGSDKQVQYNNGGVTAADANFTWTSSTQLLSVPSSTISGTLKIPNGTAVSLTATGTIGINTTARTATIHDGTAQVYLNPEQCTNLFVIENPTSTAGTIDNNPGTMVWIFNATSTITKVKAINTKVGDTATWNLTYNTNRNSATSTFAVFSAQQTTTATTTISLLTSFASSTPGKDAVLRVSFTAASSSQFGVQTCYRENQ